MAFHQRLDLLSVCFPIVAIFQSQIVAQTVLIVPFSSAVVRRVVFFAEHCRHNQTCSAPLALMADHVAANTKEGVTKVAKKIASAVK